MHKSYKKDEEWSTTVRQTHTAAVSNSNNWNFLCWAIAISKKGSTNCDLSNRNLNSWPPLKRIYGKKKSFHPIHHLPTTLPNVLLKNSYYLEHIFLWQICLHMIWNFFQIIFFTKEFTELIDLLTPLLSSSVFKICLIIFDIYKKLNLHSQNYCFLFFFPITFIQKFGWNSIRKNTLQNPKKVIFEGSTISF